MDPGEKAAARAAWVSARARLRHLLPGDRAWHSTRRYMRVIATDRAPQKNGTLRPARGYGLG